MMKLKISRIEEAQDLIKMNTTKLEANYLNKIDDLFRDRRSYLEKMSDDSRFRISDFIPLIGEERYKGRTEGYLLASIFSPPLNDDGVLNTIQERGEILKGYNQCVAGLCSLATAAVLYNIKS